MNWKTHRVANSQDFEQSMGERQKTEYSWSFGLICPHLPNCLRRPPILDDLPGRFVWATETPSITRSSAVRGARMPWEAMHGRRR